MPIIRCITLKIFKPRYCSATHRSALHVGTHIDGAMHGTDAMGDMASYSLDFLVSPGVIVDISDYMDDWAVITPEMLEAAAVEKFAQAIFSLFTPAFIAIGKASRSKIWYGTSACIPVDY